MTDCCVNSEDKAKTAWGVAVGVLGALIAGFTWLAVTYSYRVEKHMVVTEVVKNLKVADIASVEQSAQAAVAVQQEAHISNPLVAAPIGQSRILQRSRSASTVHCFRSESDAVQNPLLRAVGLSSAAAPLHRADDNMNTGTPTREMRSVARQITVRCLRRWDGFLGIRASSDGLGRRSGIWRDKSDGVHYAVLLLALNRLNETINSAAQDPSELWLKLMTCLV